MVQQVNTGGLWLHTNKIMELESVIAIIKTMKIPLKGHPQYKGKHTLTSGQAGYREVFCYIASSKNKGNLETYYETLICSQVFRSGYMYVYEKDLYCFHQTENRWRDVTVMFYILSLTPSQGKEHGLVVGGCTCNPEAPGQNPLPCHYYIRSFKFLFL